MLSTQRKILLLGPSGAGKSTLCNAIYNQNVELKDLTQPAKVSSDAIGHKITNYWCDNTLVVTDTIGFDDPRYKPAKIAEELRRMLNVPDLFYEKIILCLKLGRITQPARVYLRLLKAIFDDPTSNMILYISGCEDGTTIDEFIQENSSSEDADLAELINSLVDQKKEFEENHIEIENIIVGSLQNHKNAEVDKRKFLNDRKVTLAKIMQAIDIDIGKVQVKISNNLFRALFEWYRWVSKRKQEIACFESGENITVKYIYGKCCICQESTEGDWIITDCYHRFHKQCFCAVESERCPTCNHWVKYFTDLPN